MQGDTAQVEFSAEGLWPPPDYYRQLDLLRQAIGQPIYLAEIGMTEINAGVSLSSDPFVLLAVIEFPRPDPYRQLCPHMLVLDDGRGVNLGRIARVSTQAFNPSPTQLLYQNQIFVAEQLFAPRLLSRESVRATSLALLAGMFGPEPGRLLASSSAAEPTTALADARSFFASDH